MEETPTGRPFPDSLCHRCAQLKLVRSARGSIFLQCRAPGLPKYLPQPVTDCAGFREAPESTV